MRDFNIRTGRDMVGVATVALAMSALVLVFSFNAGQPWSVVGGFCAGLLTWLATCYAVVGTRIIREESDETET